MKIAPIYRRKTTNGAPEQGRAKRKQIEGRKAGAAARDTEQAKPRRSSKPWQLEETPGRATRAQDPGSMEA